MAARREGASARCLRPHRSILESKMGAMNSSASPPPQPPPAVSTGHEPAGEPLDLLGPQPFRDHPHSIAITEACLQLRQYRWGFIGISGLIRLLLEVLVGLCVQSCFLSGTGFIPRTDLRDDGWILTAPVRIQPQCSTLFLRDLLLRRSAAHGVLQRSRSREDDRDEAASCETPVRRR